MTLEKKIEDAIEAELDGDEGRFYVEIFHDDLLVCVEGGFSIDGYTEDDYFNGTGGFVTTEACVWIDNISAYNDEGDDVDVEVNISEIEHQVEKCVMCC